MQTTIPEIGKTIKELRSRLGLTLDQVAERSGCTPGFLSQVERNKAVPSITTLQAIAKALGVNVIDLFRDEVHPARLVRHDSRESFQFEGSTTTYSLLSAKFSYGGMAAFLMTMMPTDQALPTDESRAHPGEEFFYVIHGALRLSIADCVYDLYPGDSAYFKSTAGHRLENHSSQPVVFLSLITPSIF
jgi:transcriptional regulator with XRE-family HTH domain